ncbi:MAG TPA: 30S ribosomal protein S9 [Acidobacteriota bacterium]|nr:30S ribosomal protein S9 [Acidobacteriota bacterium]
MEKDVFMATGRRKAAVVRVRLQAGNGSFTVNGREVADYLMREALIELARRPLKLTENLGAFDVTCSAHGGGISGQAGAISLAVSRALNRFSADYRPRLRKAGLLTRDAREVERKKYGQPKARKRFQYSKR